MNIDVEIKQVYGKEMIYPIDDNARYFALISGHKTLTREVIKWIKAMGYAVTVKSQISEL